MASRSYPNGCFGEPDSNPGPPPLITQEQFEIFRSRFPIFDGDPTLRGACYALDQLLIHRRNLTPLSPIITRDVRQRPLQSIRRYEIYSRHMAGGIASPELIERLTARFVAQRLHAKPDSRVPQEIENSLASDLVRIAAREKHINFITLDGKQGDYLAVREQYPANFWK